jgi:uncharacterized protein (DUF427 family)
MMTIDYRMMDKLATGANSHSFVALLHLILVTGRIGSSGILNHRSARVMQAVWNNNVLAQSEDTVVVDGNHYFPPVSIRAEFFKPSTTTSVCPWKGTASYYTLDVDGQKNPDAAWYYPAAKAAASKIEGRVAFWKGVQVSG